MEELRQDELGLNYDYSVSYLVDICQRSGILTFKAMDPHPPVGIFTGLHPMNSQRKHFTVEMLDRGMHGYISVGIVPDDYPLNNQPGWRQGSIAYHGDDGGIFVEDGQPQQRYAPFTRQDYVNAGKRFVTAMLNMLDGDYVQSITFYLSTSKTFGPGDVICTVPVRNQACLFYPAVGFHSPGEKARLVDKGVWSLKHSNIQYEYYSFNIPFNVEEVTPSKYEFSVCYLANVSQQSGIIHYKATTDGAPVGIVAGLHPISRHRNHFTIEVLSPGLNGCISIGFVPKKYPLKAQPGWKSKSIGYHGDDGGIFVADGSPQQHCMAFTQQDYNAGRCFVTAKINASVNDEVESVTFYYSSTPDFQINDEQCTVPMSGSLSKYYPAVGFHSPGEKARLVDRTVWTLEDVKLQKSRGQDEEVILTHASEVYGQQSIFPGIPLPSDLKPTNYPTPIGFKDFAAGAQSEDGFDTFGKHVANELRQIENVNAQRLAKLKIQQILYEAQVGPAKVLL